MMGGFGGCCGIGLLGNNGGLGWIGGIFNLLILIAFVVGFAILVAWLVRQFRSNATGPFSRDLTEFATTSPKEIIATRYARGEIDREEYQRMISDLD